MKGLGGTIAMLLACASSASAGWVIDQSVKGTADVRQQVVVQSNRMKTVVLEPDGKPSAAFIVDLDADTITQVDYDEKTYATTPVRDYVQAVTAMQQTASRQMAEMLKNVPPEHRKNVEETLRQRMGTLPATGDCREPKVELRPTAETATVGGFPAVRHDVLADGKPELQVWVARSLTAWREIDPQKLQRFASQMAKLAACGSGARGLGGDAAWRVASEGYPVRTIDPSGATVEVEKAASRAIPAAEFQPPAGFARKTFGDMMSR
jgi:hypothetical protein